MAKVTFDGVNKVINVLPLVASIDVEKELYSEWKYWVQTGAGAQYEPAFRTFGGDNTAGTQTAPKYFFLTNGWRLHVNGLDLIIATNLYTDEGDSPVITSGNASVSISNSDVPVVKNDIENRLDYNGAIIVDTLIGTSGSAYPWGTVAQPVNNVADALTLGSLFNITKFIIRGSLVIDQDMVGMTLVGDNANSEVIISTGADVTTTTFDSLNITGDLGDFTVKAINCNLEDCNNLAGEIINCGLRGTLETASGSDLTFDKCSSRMAGNLSPVLDLGVGNNCTVAIRSYSGGLEIVNCDTPDSVVTVEYVAGKTHINSSCTDGLITLRGDTVVTDDSVGSTVDIDAVTPFAVANQVWNTNTTSAQSGSILEFITKQVFTFKQFMGFK